MNKPPLGLMPEDIYDLISNSKRMTEILDAMTRYSEANRPIPIIWVEELRRRIEWREGGLNESSRL